MKQQTINPKSKATTSFGLTEGSKESADPVGGDTTIGQTPNLTKHTRLGSEMMEDESKMFPLGAFSL